MQKQKFSQRGQTLVLLLILMVVAITITSAATVIALTNAQDTTKLDQGSIAYNLAESGAENALLRLLRDPNYTGEMLSIGQGTSTSTVSGAVSKTITADGRIGNFTRKVQVNISYNNNVLSINSWKEIAP